MNDYSVITGSNPWQDQLNLFNTGKGAYWVPDPGFGMTLNQLKAGLNTAQSFAAEIEDKFNYIKSSEFTNPMHNLVTLLKQKAFLYQLAIDDLQGIDTPVPGPIEENIEPLDPAETVEKKSNMPLILLGAGLVGLFLYSKSGTRQKVTGVDELLPVAVGLGALYFLTKKPTNPAPVNVVNMVDQPPPVIEASKYLR